MVNFIFYHYVYIQFKVIISWSYQIQTLSYNNVNRDMRRVLILSHIIGIFFTQVDDTRFVKHDVRFVKVLGTRVRSHVTRHVF